MDPSLLAMLLSSGANPEGAGDSMLNPQGSMPLPAGQGPAIPGAGPNIAGAAGGLGKMLSGVQAPSSPTPVFSGGVHGSALPYVSRMEDMISPFLNATKPEATGMLPTLGALLSQAPGGGR